MENKITNYNSLDDSQKINYVKNLLFNSNLNDALDSILKDEKKDLKWIKIIKDVLDEKLMINRIKEQCNLNDDLSAKAYVYSRILAILDFYKKTVILNAFFKNLNEDEIKMVANYEYQNKTNVSFNNKIFNKYCSKYKESAINEIRVDDAKIKKLDIEKERYNALSDEKMKIKKKINIKYIIMLVLIGIIIGITQIQFYFFNDLSDDIARVGMLVASIFIGIDHFPLGAGFGTFASFYSGQVYSPLYIDYDISWMYGLTEDHPSLVSDAFWPMIIGQNGYIGLIIFIIILVKIFKEIQKIYYIDKYKYMSGIFVFLYLMIASLAESAFVHPIAMPLALILGICLKKKSI